MPVCEYFPKNSGGTFRQVKFSKYLQDNGVEPIVVAPNWNRENTKDFDESMLNKEPCRVERVDLALDRDNDLIKRVMNRITLHPKYYEGNLAYNTLEKCREICENEKIDIIFASSLPSYIHWIANKLNKEFNIPWIADFRDVFDQEPINFSFNIQFLKEKIRRYQERFYDIKYVKSASAITTVSEGLAEILKTRFNQDIEVIMNGIDFTDFQNVDIKPNTKEYLDIVYTGSFFGERNPSVLFHALNILDRKGIGTSDLKVTFYGKCTEVLDEYLHILNQKNYVVNGGVLEHKLSIERIFNSDILYLISHRSKGIVTGKIFEYLASSRPILSIPGDGDIVDKILKDTNSGLSLDNPEKIAKQLLHWIDIKRNKGHIESTTIMEKLLIYTRQGQAEQLANLIKKILETDNNEDSNNNRSSPSIY